VHSISSGASRKDASALRLLWPPPAYSCVLALVTVSSNGSIASLLEQSNPKQWPLYTTKRKPVLQPAISESGVRRYRL
jgi:hypothetical protein